MTDKEMIHELKKELNDRLRREIKLQVKLRQVLKEKTRLNLSASKSFRFYSEHQNTF